TRHGELGRRGDREEGLVRADVCHRLLPPDVLLAGLEGHAERSVSIDVSSQADDASRHLADVLLSAREDPEEWTAEIHRRAKGLALPDHDVRGEIAGRSHDCL